MSEGQENSTWVGFLTISSILVSRICLGSNLLSNIPLPGLNLLTYTPYPFFSLHRSFDLRDGARRKLDWEKEDLDKNRTPGNSFSSLALRQSSAARWNPVFSCHWGPPFTFDPQSKGQHFSAVVLQATAYFNCDFFCHVCYQLLRFFLFKTVCFKTHKIFFLLDSRW